MKIFSHREDKISGLPLFRCKRLKFPAGLATYSTSSTQPKLLFLILDDSKYIVVDEFVSLGEVDKLLSIQLAQTVNGPYPDISFLVYINASKSISHLGLFRRELVNNLLLQLLIPSPFAPNDN